MVRLDDRGMVGGSTVLQIANNTSTTGAVCGMMIVAAGIGLLNGGALW